LPERKCPQQCKNADINARHNFKATKKFSIHTILGDITKEDKQKQVIAKT